MTIQLLAPGSFALILCYYNMRDVCERDYVGAGLK